MLPWAQAFAGTSGQGSIKQWRRMSSAEQADGQGRPAPWGYWATAGWVGVALLCSLIASLAVLTVWQPEALAGSGELLKNGPLISLTGIISAVAEITVLALAARLAGWPEADYLGLVPGIHVFLFFDSIKAWMAGTPGRLRPSSTGYARP